MINVSILGTGKVGTHLIKACINSPVIQLVQIYNRSEQGLTLYQGLTPTTTDLNSLKQADLYIVALPDDVIKTINLSHLQGLIVHTSGTKSFNILQAKRRGVFYPAQSFTKEKKINFKAVPVCLETEFNADFRVLQNFASMIAQHVYEISEEKRQKLHLAAVFANNFSNRVMGIAYDICKEHQIDFQILQPLLQETFLKTQILPPKVAQTGPAVRNDAETIEKHLNQLKGTNKEVYQILTKSIQEKHGIKL
ncbi:Rossmann-like and DUF2520 domain-containing protein [Wenyingzhuangia marina]|uniref:Predicted oxidoreductase, contains short-chain dehydrogenase (SDR) and DUF2520 domains n=2 Tax=Wenyingzhuangia marina TaxID=1195760 RepID=A0A1M5U2F4_9FLAO|nr:Rossmann-like and DUF2520 domain-containing protein [Wenyingzhuangia marina]GGF70037.1 hypothetical protein GCM10011397_11190 [Wenyingzhuangia marina]SHH56823.1 Predicted oxidoreductase, contains short-chain dehydrogenase (SDR) and DUF2520 domains [Wenyingzhuangia marina]